MKNIRKVISVILTLVMVMSMSASVFAATITMKNGATDSVYSVYKLLKATDGGDGKFAYTLNDTYTSILQEVTEKTTQADIVDYIQKLDATGIRTFADAVYAKITAADPAMSADYTITGNASATVDQGYYLIAETTASTSDTTDTYSLVMVDTAGNEAVEVSTKEGKPTVDKNIVGGTNKESTDAKIGDTINFEIIGTLSSQYADYDSYYYKFADTMSAGLTLDTDSIVVTVYDASNNKVGVITDSFAKSTTAQSFTLTSDLKEITTYTINADYKIVVTYSATLNANAVSESTGNTNEVTLTYETDPYNEGDGDSNPTTVDEPDDPGETPKDVNIVYTFDTIVNKVDKDGNALDGAGFTLYKNTGSDNGSNANWVAVGDEIKDVTTFKFEGLDVGTYKLVETTVPSGYNKAADVIFEIVATYSEEDGNVIQTLVVNDAEGNEIKVGTFTATMSKGEVETTITNNAGTELPETGGIGTTIFYVVGSVLVLGAVVLLVTKKRMNTQ